MEFRYWFHAARRWALIWSVYHWDMLARRLTQRCELAAAEVAVQQADKLRKQLSEY